MSKSAEEAIKKCALHKSNFHILGLVENIFIVLHARQCAIRHVTKLICMEMWLIKIKQPASAVSNC